MFPALRGVKVTRTSRYTTEDGLNFTGIDFPTPVSQIDRLERQNPNLAINVFRWENERVGVHRISEKRRRNPKNKLKDNEARRKHALQLCEKAHSTFI